MAERLPLAYRLSRRYASHIDDVTTIIG